MVALATERSPDSGLTSAVAEPAFGAVHGVALAVGPQAEKVRVPVGEPAEAVPVTVAVSVSVEPRAMVALPSADFSDGVEVDVVPVTSRHSVPALLSLTGL